MRFAVAVDNRKVATLFRAIESAGFHVELVADDLPVVDPGWPLVVFGPLPPRSVDGCEDEGGLVFAGEILIDLETRLAYRGSRRLELGARAFDVLTALALHADRVVDREDVRRWVWGGRPVGDNTVEVHVSALRRKLGGDGRSIIETVRGQGYVLRTPRCAAPRLEVLLDQRLRALRQREDAVARREASLLARRHEPITRNDTAAR